MTNHEKLLRTPSLFRMFTGLSASEFAKLVADLEPVWLARKAKRAARRRRHRASGAGRKAKLVFTDRLLLTLLYYRAYVTQEFVGFLFGVDKGTVSREVQELGLCMAGVFRIPEKKVRIDLDELEAVFVDATEQSVNRPTRKQRQSYSGKKKRHTLKHQVVVTRKRKGPGEKQKVRIKAVSKGAKGRVHDKKLYDRSRLRIPKGVPKSGDSGYQGSDLRVPKKKPRKGQLSDEEKRANRRLAKERIVAEHGIGKMKIWRIAADRYRNPPRRHTVMMKNVAGRHNRMYG
jgi:DDE superfamily endonuclease/Helix-turn-helix of DDE superfamily endonuclease